MSERDRHNWYIKNYNVSRQEQPLELNVDTVGILEDLLKEEIRQRGMDAAEQDIDIKQILNNSRLSDEAVNALQVAGQRAAHLTAGHPLEFYEAIYTVAKNVNFDHTVELEQRLGIDNIVDTHPATNTGKENIKQIIRNAESRIDEIESLRGHRHSESVWDALDAELKKVEKVSELIKNSDFSADFDEIKQKREKLKNRREMESGRIEPGLEQEKVLERLKNEFPDTYPIFKNPTVAEQNIREIKAKLEAFRKHLATDLPVKIGYSEEVSNLSLPNAGDYFFEHGVDGTDHMVARDVEEKQNEVILDRLNERVNRIGDAVDNLDRVSRELSKKQLAENTSSKSESETSNQTERDYLSEPSSGDATEQHSGKYLAEPESRSDDIANKEVTGADSVGSDQSSAEQSENESTSDTDNVFDLESDTDNENYNNSNSQSM